MDQETALNAARGHLRALLKEMCSAPGWRVGTDWWYDRLQAAQATRREVDRLEFLHAVAKIREISKKRA